LLADVAMEEARGGAELGGERRARLVEHVEQRDPCAFGDEAAGHAGALALRGAGDDRDLVLESSRHGHSASYGNRVRTGICTISIGKPSGSRTTQHSM